MSNWLKDTHSRIENKTLVYSWIGSVILIITMMISFYFEISTSYFGIAQNKEIEISFPFSVKIQKIHVVPGQIISRGQLLMEVNQPELEIKVSGMNLKIAELEAQISLNQELSGELASLKKNRRTSEMDHNENPEIKQHSNPIIFEIARLKAELDLIEKQRRSLQTLSQTDGVVSTVQSLSGETISPYTPIITLNRIKPSLVQGFVEENAYASTIADQDVWVSSVADPSKVIRGKVTTIGTRIVAFPERLKIVPTLSVFGREVTVSIPHENQFLVGEKVKITSVSESSDWFYFSALAGIKK